MNGMAIIYFIIINNPFLSPLALNWLFLGDTNRMIAEVSHICSNYNIRAT